MRIATIGDVHGNLPALEAVLTHARQQGAQKIWNVGDFVGYGPFPEEVVRLLGERAEVNIQGNYDRKTLKVPKKLEKWKLSKAPEKWQAFSWAYEHLSAESRDFLTSLPEQDRQEVESWQVLLVHGSPADPDEHLTPQTRDERLLELAEIAKADVVICGHSHRPFVRFAGRTWFVNTGTVGRPDDGDPRACYAMLTLSHNGFEVAYHRVEYDIARTVAAIREAQLPEIYVQMIETGHNLEEVQPNL